ncbi:MAG: ABC transporter ATP-binding protein, partial [Chthoniobacterales bacterium]
MNAHEPAVICRDVVKTYGKGEIAVRALKGVSLEARFGELLMIVGPSGCGKTTLLSVICGTLRIDSGTIELFGKTISSMPDRELTAFRARNVGFIFQQFNLVPTLTARENVSIPRLLTGVSYDRAQEDAGAMLARVGLGGREESFPSQMSGGQQQRVAISRAMVHQPRLVICDEPTASLDAAAGQRAMDLLRESARHPDRCVIVVTHDSRIFHYADRIVEMDDGLVTASQSASDYLRD